MDQNRYITVTALTRHIKRKLETDDRLQNVWIRGELSNFKVHSRGHMYFTLKDECSRIQSVMFAGNNRFLKFRPESGMKVLIRGEVSVYEPHGSYQLYAKEMQPDGIGNLYLAYEQLKKKLELEGLFEDALKKSIPAFPREIAVVTSPTGAAVRDIITTVKRRFPVARVTVFPVLVQGGNAAPSIAKAIHRANETGGYDVLIVGRGGGSIEELWAFNEEIVARSIHLSQIPVISAVGHETDFTIADFVADLRAPTPTGAAELAVPSLKELYDRLVQRKHRLLRVSKERLRNERERLSTLQKSYAFRYPQQLIRQKEQELDQLTERFKRELARLYVQKNEKWIQATKDLQRNHPQKKLQEALEKHSDLTGSLTKEMGKVLKEKQFAFHQSLAKLNALSPLKVMERGYNLAYVNEDTLVKSVKQVSPGDAVKLQVQDGTIDCQVWGIEESERNGR
ncbi:exodeoxyribonuclease VII large subunit [Pseudalkalibacillus caeni]|uniref:Exodeoxyribonuclease 7 large subunit n=1 Tax=Exobacillus caeni TaxID=2574798 RepID=A0A5R9EYW6_9BACL|nr:exodeoxyribonuclease VII large subunit [Pseudalkalibacillus caeni]TLS36377.1 exodeoxyribonuclease VII large subunit [Pseudalkalibacillus caeni]